MYEIALDLIILIITIKIIICGLIYAAYFNTKNIKNIYFWNVFFLFFPWKETVFHWFCLYLLDNNQERVSEEMVRVRYKVTHTHWSRYPPTQLIRSRGRVGELFPSETTSILCGSGSKHHDAFCSGRQIPERHQPTTAAQLILGNWEHGGLIPWEPVPRISNTAHTNTEDVIWGAWPGVDVTSRSTSQVVDSNWKMSTHRL